MGIHWGIYEEEYGRTVACEAGQDDAGKATVKAAQLISVYVIWFCFYHSHQQTHRKDTGGKSANWTSRLDIAEEEEDGK